MHSQSSLTPSSFAAGILSKIGFSDAFVADLVDTLSIQMLIKYAMSLFAMSMLPFVIDWSPDESVCISNFFLLFPSPFSPPASDSPQRSYLPTPAGFGLLGYVYMILSMAGSLVSLSAGFRYLQAAFAMALYWYYLFRTMKEKTD